ncbi:MAG: hypothetical protein A2527_00075 [Candidatus Lambdaproteobacteria bacterium RIFOXYD2_FULL_50_16]|uniref:STAS domain-containing protein n=1 Tax=Candidatus Lambdaproteobacteria bacterium RIFOXYD2_FULL_50_16 TaxID=1817772 RepID=A0A1F6GFM2_9PROT|nr:MAG: hypothetical protein A2527_00075 [Candidatus Lambdaproteobacteria bacterium RIFOXYD2_FULL_50_16]
MNPSFEQVAGALLIHLTGPLEKAELNQKIEWILTQPGPGVVLNCAQLQTIDAAGFSFLVFLYKRLGQSGKKLALCGLRPNLLHLFMITRLDQVLKCFVSTEAALAYLAL